MNGTLQFFPPYRPLEALAQRDLYASGQPRGILYTLRMSEGPNVLLFIYLFMLLFLKCHDLVPPVDRYLCVRPHAPFFVFSCHKCITT